MLENPILKRHHSYFGSDRATLLKIYNAVIKYKLDCGYFTFSLAHKYFSIPQQHLSLGHQMAIRAFPTSPIPSILCKANVLHFELYCNLNEIKSYIHIKSNSYLAFSLSSTHFPTSLSSAKSIEQYLACLELTKSIYALCNPNHLSHRVSLGTIILKSTCILFF